MEFKHGEVLVGDNLPNLRELDDEVVDFIYIDPPFNKGVSWHGVDGTEFQDDWKMGEVAFSESMEIAKRHPVLSDLIRTAGNVAGEATQSYLSHIGLRLLELRRTLKPTGALLLHCDHTESAWLCASMQAVFGRKNYLNELVWRRLSTATGVRTRLRQQQDTIHVFSKQPNKHTFNIVHEEGKVEEIRNRYYKRKDEHGLYKDETISTTSPNNTKRKNQSEWKGCLPTTRGYHKCWVGPPISTYPESARALLPEGFSALETMEKLDVLDELGLIHWMSSGRPRHKRYWTGEIGATIGSLITCFSGMQGGRKRSTSYPTQKPVSLLRFLVESFSNPGDAVLDCYCGSGTTLIAAQQTGRQWMGMDLSELAHQTVFSRLEIEGMRPTPKIKRGKKRKRVVVDDGQFALKL